MQDYSQKEVIKLSNALKLHFDIDGDDFTPAGEASTAIKMKLKKLGVSPDVIRKTSIAMYEAEINTVIHGGGGMADVSIDGEKIVAVFSDTGKGIPDVEMAMREGFSTAPDEVRNLGFGAGMGLPNIKKYSDDLKIESEVGKGTTLTITINL